MRKFLSRTAPWVSIAAFLALVSWVVLTSKPFQECIEKNGGSSSGEQFQQGISPLQIIPAIVRDCLGEFTHKNADPIIAAFTIILSLATIALWFATRRLVKGAEETGRRQLRAYVSFSNPKPIVTALVAGQHPMIEHYVHNHGQTPAYNYRAWHEIVVYPKNSPPMGTFSDLPFDAHRRVVNPHDSFRVEVKKDAALTSEEVNGIGHETLVLYLYGRMEFEDAFGETRWVTTRIRWDASRLQFVATEDGNKAN